MSDSNGHIPISAVESILAQFLKLSKDNNTAYEAMASAIEVISASNLDMVDKLKALTRTINDEKLANVMTDCTTAIQENVAEMNQSLTSLQTIDFTSFNTLSNILEYHNIDQKEFMQALVTHVQTSSGTRAEDLSWALSVIGWFRKRFIRFMLLVGITAGLFLANNGFTFYELITKFILK